MKRKSKSKINKVDKIIPISEGRKRLFEIAENVQSPGSCYTLTSDGKPRVVIISAEEYDSMLDTLGAQSWREAHVVAEKPKHQYGRKRFIK